MTEPRALVGNASDPEQVQAADRVEKRIQVSNEGARDAVMRTPEGRQFLWWILEQCGLFASVMRGGPDMRDFYAGQQDLGHKLLEEVKTDPELYLSMQSEAYKRAQHLKATPKKRREQDMADARAEA